MNQFIVVLVETFRNIVPMPIEHVVCPLPDVGTVRIPQNALDGPGIPEGIVRSEISSLLVRYVACNDGVPEDQIRSGLHRSAMQSLR